MRISYCWVVLFTGFISVPVYADDLLSLDAIERRIRPIGQVTFENEVPAPAASVLPGLATPLPIDRGKYVYENNCILCHDTGAAGAPKFGHATDWAPRAKKGMSVLLMHVTNGFNFMPPKGTCSQCSSSDLNAAIQYILDHSLPKK